MILYTQHISIQMLRFYQKYLICLSIKLTAEKVDSYPQDFQKIKVLNNRIKYQFPLIFTSSLTKVILHYYKNCLTLKQKLMILKVCLSKLNKYNNSCVFIIISDFYMKSFNFNLNLHTYLAKIQISSSFPQNFKFSFFMSSMVLAQNINHTAIFFDYQIFSKHSFQENFELE